MTDENRNGSTEKNNQRLEKLPQREEGQFLEFKSCYERPGGKGPGLRHSKEVADDVAAVLSAMANADGGKSHCLMININKLLNTLGCTGSIGERF